MLKKKLNVRLLRRVRAHILEEPNRLRMSDWKLTAAPGDLVGVRTTALSMWGETTQRVPACGTVACIAGWTQELGAPKSVGYTPNVAARLLGLRKAPNELFLVSNWPEPFQSQYLRARSQRRRAEIGARRIDAFIAEYCPRSKEGREARRHAND